MQLLIPGAHIIMFVLHLHAQIVICKAGIKFQQADIKAIQALHIVLSAILHLLLAKRTLYIFPQIMYNKALISLGKF